jgi:hypothetical protein
MILPTPEPRVLSCVPGVHRVTVDAEPIRRIRKGRYALN